MGSEGPPAITVHVTGFKKFHGVAENPTEKIVRNLKSFMEKRGLPKGLVLGNCTVLEAAGQSALGPLYELLESTVVGREYGSPNQEQVILLHFGANSGSPRFALENQAVNEATFHCPDELGWKPQRVPIMSSDGSISRTRQVASAIRDSTETVASDYTACEGNNQVPPADGLRCDVMPSDDAGRFVCNYVYYHSLRFAEKHGIKSLFIHSPLFVAIDEDVQMHFVSSLLEVIASLN